MPTDKKPRRPRTAGVVPPSTDDMLAHLYDGDPPIGAPTAEPFPFPLAGESDGSVTPPDPGTIPIEEYAAVLHMVGSLTDALEKSRAAWDDANARAERAEADLAAMTDPAVLLARVLATPDVMIKVYESVQRGSVRVAKIVETVPGRQFRVVSFPKGVDLGELSQGDSGKWGCRCDNWCVADYTKEAALEWLRGKLEAIGFRVVG